MNDSLLVKIAEAQGRMEAKMDQCLAAVNDHSKRIGKLERQWTRLVTWMTLGLTTVGVVLKTAFGKKA